MKRWVIAFALALPTFAAAQKKDKPAPPPPAQTAAPKSKSYQFTGLDIDGKLKTPQLIYFLNRMKSEFDTTMPERRSFLPELKRSTDEM
jgi:hypothetical protein